MSILYEGTGVERLNKEAGKSRRGPAAVRGAVLHKLRHWGNLRRRRESDEPKPEELPV